MDSVEYTKKELKMIKDIINIDWGFGIEHEMQIYHQPRIEGDKKIQDFILFDSKSAVERLLKAYNEFEIDLTLDQVDYLKNMTFESSGRFCNGKWVIKEAPYLMPEFITYKPFCSMRKKRNIFNLTKNIIELKDIFLELLMKEKVTQQLVKKYGELVQYPYGMTRYMSVPNKIVGSNYQFKLTDKRRPMVKTDYTGSYHITFTLPYTEDKTEKKFIEEHQNFGNQIQWLEPLMLVGFFSGDESAVGSKEKRVRGSYRVLNIGWGNLAGSDVRLFGTKGIGRYAKTPNYWREGLNLFETEKLKPCIPASPSALKELGISSLSSDLRTFGSRDPLRPQHRESGLPMNKPNGIEIRIFDNFNNIYMDSLTSFIALIAENSRVTKTKGYVYQDKDWIQSLHQIMKDGYKAELTIGYIQSLRSKLGLKIKTSSVIAMDVWDEIYKELYHKKKNGEWTKIFFGIQKGKKELEEMYTFTGTPQINKEAWSFAFYMKCNRDPDLLHTFNQLSVFLNQSFKTKTSITFFEMEKYITQILGQNWKQHTDDILYLLYQKHYIDLERNIRGFIESFKLKKEIPLFYNFNEEILKNIY